MEDVVTPPVAVPTLTLESLGARLSQLESLLVAQGLLTKLQLPDAVVVSNSDEEEKAPLSPQRAPAAVPHTHEAELDTDRVIAVKHSPSAGTLTKTDPAGNTHSNSNRSNISDSSASDTVAATQPALVPQQPAPFALQTQVDRRFLAVAEVLSLLVTALTATRADVAAHDHLLAAHGQQLAAHGARLDGHDEQLASHAAQLAQLTPYAGFLAKLAHTLEPHNFPLRDGAALPAPAGPAAATAAGASGVACLACGHGLAPAPGALGHGGDRDGDPSLVGAADGHYGAGGGEWWLAQQPAFPWGRGLRRGRPPRGSASAAAAAATAAAAAAAAARATAEAAAAAAAKAEARAGRVAAFGVSPADIDAAAAAAAAAAEAAARAAAEAADAEARAQLLARKPGNAINSNGSGNGADSDGSVGPGTGTGNGHGGSTSDCERDAAGRALGGGVTATPFGPGSGLDGGRGDSSDSDADWSGLDPSAGADDAGAGNDAVLAVLDDIAAAAATGLLPHNIRFAPGPAPWPRRLAYPWRSAGPAAVALVPAEKEKAGSSTGVGGGDDGEAGSGMRLVGAPMCTLFGHHHSHENGRPCSQYQNDCSTGSTLADKAHVHEHGAGMKQIKPLPVEIKPAAAGDKSQLNWEHGAGGGSGSLNGISAGASARGDGSLSARSGNVSFTGHPSAPARPATVRPRPPSAAAPGVSATAARDRERERVTVMVGPALTVPRTGGLALDTVPSAAEVARDTAPPAVPVIVAVPATKKSQSQYSALNLSQGQSRRPLTARSRGSTQSASVAMTATTTTPAAAGAGTGTLATATAASAATAAALGSSRRQRGAAPAGALAAELAAVAHSTTAGATAGFTATATSAPLGVTMLSTASASIGAAGIRGSDDDGAVKAGTESSVENGISSSNADSSSVKVSSGLDGGGVDATPVAPQPLAESQPDSHEQC